MTGVEGGRYVGPRAGVAPAGHVVLDETSGAACAVASWDGWLHLAWTGTDGRLNLMTSADGASFGTKATLRHRSTRTQSNGEQTNVIPLEPALSATDRGVFLAWTGTDRQLNVLLLGAAEDANAIIPERSSNGPVLTTWGAELVLGWTGSDRRLNFSVTYEGRFARPITLEHKSSRRPALTTWEGQPLLAWAGTDQQLNLMPLGAAPYGQPTFPGGYTNRAPAMATVSDALVLAWRGTDRRMCVRTAQRGEWGPVSQLPMTSSHAPAVCCHRNNLVLAWTGTDRRINVAMLRPT